MHTIFWLQLREDVKKGVYVENLSEFEVHTVFDILKLLRQVTSFFPSSFLKFLFTDSYDIIFSPFLCDKKCVFMEIPITQLNFLFGVYRVLPIGKLLQQIWTEKAAVHTVFLHVWLRVAGRRILLLTSVLQGWTSLILLVLKGKTN